MSIAFSLYPLSKIDITCTLFLNNNLEKMQTTKKLFSLVFSALLIAMVVTPAAFAATCTDEDGDGYITITGAGAGDMFKETGFDANGNYTGAEWKNYLNTYKNGLETYNESLEDEAIECSNINFKKGAEPTRCDTVVITEASGVYDPSVVRSVSGSQVHPGAFDKADNGIDEDCDGADGKLIITSGAEKDLGGLLDKVMMFLSRAVVVISIIIMIWAGMLYATAAGDEQKTAKARKAIIGAIIGLIVGLLAPSIINFITASLV